MTTDQEKLNEAMKTFEHFIDVDRLGCSTIGACIVPDALEAAREVIRLQDAINPPAAKWSAEAPTVPGWYWRKGAGGVIHGYTSKDMINHPEHAEWSACFTWIGPIPEPK